ncbi:ABC transporter substrate-binding protein [Pelagibius litoralis]|uniref:ABC transporter substrate-binding protein n=1 Tax=Pelagibius litoralis TaxID=374515 RepID=A0A967KG31_9PROT|nr:ABC transporter substrate-binding protein [Pelagibius litoralis]NIA71775.1 ABC transporter substrate-binding protein [Pelagibius litoralis]
MKTMLKTGLSAAAVSALLFTSLAVSAETIFLSTQARPIEEAEAMRNTVLGAYQGEVDYIPQEDGPFLNRVLAEAEAGDVSIGLLGALHGNFPVLAGADALAPVDDIMASLGDRKLINTFVELGKLGTDKQHYVPWMQASYVMAANREALQYLPEGADVMALTYDQLATWSANVQTATGERKLGFPAGRKGLMHRFFQGYLYPSFTNSVVTEYRGEKAAAMWAGFRDLWKTVNPRSTSYDFMQEPLLAGEVWIAFDHTARLMDAFNQRPDDFIAFPAPAGPEGRGFMPVVAGLAVPANGPDRAAAAKLIDYMTRPETQIATLKAIGFFPAIEMDLPDDLPRGVQIAGAAVSAQSASPDANPSLLPVGLGDKGREFNKVFMDTFQLIVLRKADIAETLDRQAGNLRKLMEETGAPCWAPDPSSAGACPVK